MIFSYVQKYFVKYKLFLSKKTKKLLHIKSKKNTIKIVIELCVIYNFMFLLSSVGRAYGIVTYRKSDD